MKHQPYIFFAVFHDNADDSEPVYAEFAPSQDNFYTMGRLDGISDQGNGTITIVWYDFESQKIYRYKHHIDYTSDLREVSFMVVTQGICCLWLSSEENTLSYHDFHCEEIDFAINSDPSGMLNAAIVSYDKERGKLSSESNEFYLSTIALMKRYHYRFFPIWADDCASTAFDVALADGTILRSEMSKGEYQMYARPGKIAVKWTAYDQDFSAFFWFDSYHMVRIFDRFYGAHPETKADFIIRIDTEKRIYELALYRQGLKEPVAIPQSAYQLIVFKNRFEDYRSENYEQPSGAWNW